MESTVGISFSKNHCYLTQLTRENGKLSLTSVTSFFYEQDPLSALHANADTVKSLISKSTRVILTLPSQDVLLKNITVDAALTDEEIIYHIQSQSLSLFGYTAEHLSFDYKTRSIEDNNRSIIIATCHQEKISAYQHYFEEIEIPLHIINVDCFSINLLPWRETKRREKHKKLRYRVTIYIIALFFLSLIFKLFLYVETQQTHSTITLLNHQISEIKLNDPLHKNESLLKKLIYFHAQQKSAGRRNNAIQNALFHIANVIPNSIILDQLILDSKKIVLTGTSNQLADIHHYVNALQTEKIGHTVQLTNIQTNEKNHSTMQFTIEINEEQRNEKQRIV